MTALGRRTLLGGLLLGAGAAAAQTPPPVKVIIPFAPGSALDLVGRPVLSTLEQVSGQPFEADNRAGGTGFNGARFVAKSEPNGQTWLFAPDTLLTASPLLYTGGNPFDAEHELAVAASICFLPGVLILNPGLGPKSLAEFLDMARDRRLNFGSGGVGSFAHLCMQYFGDLANLKLRHVPYRGGNLAVADVISGQADCAFVIVPNALEAIRKNEVLPLAVSSSKRVPALADLPTLDESGFPDFDVLSGYFAWLPARTPPDVLARAEEQVRTALSQPGLLRKLRELGTLPVPVPGATAMAWMLVQRERWTKLIQAHAITPE
jgi:tripartite-type tricarboxylate transporter receptor subunit TctC